MPGFFTDWGTACGKMALHDIIVNAKNMKVLFFKT
jgi:hypothetical protein